MPDWKELVRQRLRSVKLAATNREEIVRELATHLEEDYETARTRGLTDAAAITHTLQEVEDWSVLARDIHHATLEDTLMNHRTKSLWLPSLASLAAASLFLLALTEISLQPHFLVKLNAGLGRSLYFGWLVAQILFGALGAFLSRRAGGTRAARIVAGTFPALVMFGLCAVAIPVSALFEPNALIFRHPLYVALGVLIWAGAPAITLLLGAAPFLRERQRPEPARA